MYMILYDTNTPKILNSASKTTMTQQERSWEYVPNAKWLCKRSDGVA